MADSKIPYLALALGALLSVIVAAYSAYAGLKVGGVYWPIVTTSIISMAVLGIIGKAGRNDINVMQTAGSSGGLLAAGIIFTIPAAMMLGIQISYMEILVISLVGGILGVLFSYPLRKQLIEKENLPCADGAAAAALINAGDKGGREAHALIYSFGIGALFSLARDFLRVLPPYINLESLKIPAGKIFSFGSSVSLIPLAGGFLIGWRFTAAWFLGAIFTYFVIIPYSLTAALFSDKFAVISEIARPLGVGVVLGSAIMFFMLKGLPQMGRLIESYEKTGFARVVGIGLIVCAGVMAIVLNLDWPLSMLAIVGAFAMAYVAARSTGEMNVDPMEIYAMLVLIAAKLLITQAALPLVILAAVVTIAAGMAGDMMQDLKAGYILGTKLEHQMAAQVAGLAASSLAIGVVLLSIQNTGGIGGINFPAPQAVAVKELISTGGIPQMLEFGGIVGAALTLIAFRFRNSFAMAPIAFGIGMYVPMELSLPLFMGGIMRHYAEKRKIAGRARVVAGGVIAGEGIVGVGLSLLGFAGVI